MRLAKCCLLLALLCFICTGCASTYGAKITMEKCNMLQKGITTKQKIINLFGKPKEIIHDDTKETLIYESVIARGSPFNQVIKKEIKRIIITLDNAGLIEKYKIDELHSEDLAVDSYHQPPPRHINY